MSDGEALNFTVAAEPSLSSDAIAATVGQVWQLLPQVFAELEIPVAVVDMDGMRLGNGGFQPRTLHGERLSQFLDCGYGAGVAAYADTYRVTMSLFSRVRQDETAATLLETEISAAAAPVAVRGDPVYCSSKGILEKRIVALVEDGLRMLPPADTAVVVTPSAPEQPTGAGFGAEHDTIPAVNPLARHGTISRVWSSPFFHFGVMLTAVLVFALSLGKSFNF